jgi:hypothetical protein
MNEDRAGEATASPLSPGALVSAGHRAEHLSGRRYRREIGKKAV